MSILEDMQRKANDLGRKTIQKTREYSDLTHLNGLISDEQKLINAAYLEIGKRYVFEHPADYEDCFIPEMKAIYEAQRRIMDYQSQIQAIKKVRTCPNCQAQVDENAAFCANCGTRIDQPALEQELRCPDCQALVRADSDFCYNCGRPLQKSEPAKRFCLNCGTELAPQESFCTNCGTRAQ